MQLNWCTYGHHRRLQLFDIKPKFHSIPFWCLHFCIYCKVSILQSNSRFVKSNHSKNFPVFFRRHLGTFWHTVGLRNLSKWNMSDLIKSNLFSNFENSCHQEEEKESLSNPTQSNQWHGLSKRVASRNKPKTFFANSCIMLTNCRCMAFIRVLTTCDEWPAYVSPLVWNTS